MSYVGKMKDLIELYLAELERDGLDNVLGVGLPVVSGILTDFAQWLEDDVQDTETTPEGNDEAWADHSRWLEATGEELNLTGFGDIVEDSLADDEGNTGFLEIGSPEWRREYIHRLGVDSAMAYLNALNSEEDSNSADS